MSSVRQVSTNGCLMFGRHCLDNRLHHKRIADILDAHHSVVASRRSKLVCDQHQRALVNP